MRYFRYLLLIAALACLLTGPIPAQAHANLERSDPPNNAVLSESPRQILLWFSETVGVRFSAMRLLDMNGRAVDGLRISQDPAQPRQLIIDVPPLSQGIYSLNWKTLSTSDGHDTQGLLVFGINQAVEGAGASAAPADNTPPVLQFASRALVDGGLCGLFGSLLVTLALLFQNKKNSPLVQAAYYHARRRATGWVITLAGLAFLAGLLQWLAQVLTSTGGSGSLVVVDWSAAFPLLVSTPWGNFWLVRQALLILAGGLLDPAPGRNGGRIAPPGLGDRCGVGFTGLDFLHPIDACRRAAGAHSAAILRFTAPDVRRAVGWRVGGHVDRYAAAVI